MAPNTTELPKRCDEFDIDRAPSPIRERVYRHPPVTARDQAPRRPAVDATVARFEAFQHRLMAVHAEEFASVDLTMAQAKLLYVVMAAGELTLSEIAGRLHVSPSTASGAVDHLVVLGHLTRADDPSNRRQIRVSITPLGVTTLEQISEIGTRQMTALFSEIADRELETVQHAIAILSDAVAALDARGAAATGAITDPGHTPRSAA